MSHVMASREGATVATDGIGAERPPRLATTLYEVLAAIQRDPRCGGPRGGCADKSHRAAPPPVRAAHLGQVGSWSPRATRSACMGAVATDGEPAARPQHRHQPHAPPLYTGGSVTTGVHG
jgi:hypothetical protein